MGDRWRAWPIAVGLALAIVLATATGSAGAQPAQAASVAQIRLSWTGDASTTMTIRWRNSDPNSTAVAQVREAGTTAWTAVTGSEVGTGPAGNELQVDLTGLTPASTYEYRLATSADAWTDIHQFHTAPDAGGQFSVAFLADTGVAGRLDGLAAGTDHVLAAIDAIEPLFVLGGGDYAYADNDHRFATPADGIDAWLDMVSPLIDERPFMPTYGNHEVLGEQALDQWIERLATPDNGFGERSSYSYDVAGVHFVSLLAYEGQLPQETIDWLVADLDAATARGVRTIVPYMHRNVYGDGGVHAPSPSLGRQLGAIFDRYDIDVVLTAHDQSYERTFPLTAGAPTTAARRCYTKADGITWIKSSPGGKLSNVSSGFSPYSSDAPSPVIAVRENALHHFSVLTVAADRIDVATYGVSGDGSPPIEVDRVSYRESCPPELAFASLPAQIQMAAPETATVEAALSPADAPVQLSTGAEWAVATLAAPGQVSVAVDATRLPPGTHSTHISATAEGYEPAVLPVIVTIPDPNARHTIVQYANAERGEATPLEGARLSGDAYLALQPTLGAIDYVEFRLDGAPVRVEDQLPFDVVGGVETASPLDTTTLADGPHTLEAVVIGSDGASTTVTAQFEVANAPPAAPAAPAAAAAAAATSTPPEAATVPGGSVAAGTPTIQTAPARRVTRVGGDEWWTNPLALAGGALFAGIALGLMGRIKAHRARPDNPREFVNSAPRRAYPTHAVGTSNPAIESTDADDHTPVPGGHR